MASEALWAAGSTFQAGDGAVSETFVNVAEVTKLTPPKMSRTDINVTHTLSSDGYEEFIGGWRDGGEVTVEANWLPLNATQSYALGLHASFNTDVRHNYRIVLPGSVATVNFSGYIKAFEPDLDITKQAMLSITIKISGKPTVS